MLRRLVEQAVMVLDVRTHRELEELCPRLGLPELPEKGSKREGLTAILAAIADPQLPRVAQQLLAENLPNKVTGHAIEDVLWAAEGAAEIPARIRRDIARGLNLTDLVHRAERFHALLDRLWLLNTDPFASLLVESTTSLRARIDRHVYRNPGDWSTEELFDQLGAFEAGDGRFARFLQGLVSPANLPDEPAQRRVVAAVNLHLRTAGTELAEIGTEGGYPVFQVVLTRSARNKSPKNLIFATLQKPDIRFRDAMDNDIEIIGDPHAVLVYDRHIGGDGIRWSDLRTWWRETRDLNSDAEATRTLYDRLRECLPENSPAQRNLFELYHELHGPLVHGLPALLPEVWLHWDPKTVKERGRDALLRFRMDFLLLLPHRQRIVLEVDGSHHYATNGRPDTAKYAAGVRGDRDLKLSGYEVFRFGADELTDRRKAGPLLQQFFKELFHRFNVTAAPQAE